MARAALFYQVLSVWVEIPQVINGLHYIIMSASTTAYDKITATIIEALESGNVPWQKPWKTIKPCNAITGKPYRGINPFLLGLSGMTFADHRWVTYKQAIELGGNVKKGEKSTWIVFFSPNVKKDGDGKVLSAYWIMKSYFVFNVEQCEGLTKLAPLEVSNVEVDANIVAEEIWAKYADKPEVQNGGLACYSPKLDKITMPRREDFTDNAHFYATLFHEGAHSTGHESRLNRKSVTESDGFGGYVYSQEELIAEFSSAFLCAEAGLDMPTFDNTVAYIQNWIQALKDDHSLVVKSAAAAQKVADYMMGVSAQSTDTEAVPDEKELVTA